MSTVESSASTAESEWSILVHGGAGDVPENQRMLHADGCRKAAEAGAEVLRKGGSALDAVEAAVRVLEDDPRFNAGTGACLNELGEIELDASIMEGDRLAAGAVAALPPFANPIAIARAVLEEQRHVLYAGEGAARWAEAHGFVRSTTEAMRTARALEKWNEVKQGKGETGWAGGTVGAVARDSKGHVAAATSTGGTFDKAVGRVGDSPILGAGTYADDRLGACSGTGHGESFMKHALALRAVLDLSTPNERAASLLGQLEAMQARVGGRGGAILVDRDGRLAWARTTATMSYAWVRRDASGEHELQGA